MELSVCKWIGENPQCERGHPLRTAVNPSSSLLVIEYVIGLPNSAAERKFADLSMLV